MVSTLPKIFLKVVFLALVTASLTSCRVSEAWALQETTPQYFPVNPSPPRDARVPMTYPVPVSHRASLASGGHHRSERSHVLVSNYQGSSQPTAIPLALPAEAALPIASAPRARRSFSAAFLAKKVKLENGRAVAPSHAPEAVHRAVAAANHLQRFPYKWGGGHARLNDDGYDCSGAVSYVLREAGLMEDQMTSRGFHRFGERGQGKWITVWAREGHVFMTIGGLRFDTGGSSNRTGPRWKPRVRSKKGHVARHPRGY